MDDAVRELVALGKDHFQRGDWSLAAGHLEQVVARGAAFADVHHMLGVCYHPLGEFDAAQRAFERALEINPAYVEASLNLAILCNDLGQYEKAQRVYANAVERARNGARAKPGDEPLDAFTRGKIANLHAAVGDAYLAARRTRDAAAEYRRALELSPAFVDLRLKLAGALREAGELQAATTELRRQDGGISIADLGSTNGAFVNGEKVKKAQLKLGDRVLIGTSILKLVSVARGAAPIDSRAAQQQLERSAAVQERRGRSVVQGRLEEVPLVDLLQLLRTSQKTGTTVIQR